jgi:hypothetical protein
MSSARPRRSAWPDAFLILRNVNQKQRKRKLERRRAHEEGSNRPRRVLHQKTYPTVKQGHIVPATYQRAFAVNGRVSVHVPGRAQCVDLRVENAGTRSRVYRRLRPDGSEIDDVEASLASLERRVGPLLGQIVAGDPVSDESKGALAQFFAVQMVRGPMFFRSNRAFAEQHIQEALTTDNAPKAALAAAGDDIDVLRERAVDALWSARFRDMIRSSQKLSWVPGCMRWQLLSFPEVRVPLSPNVLLLMTWEDLDDTGARLSTATALAGDTDSLVIAQADRQWMHRPGTEPPVSKRLLRPISRELNPPYDHPVAERSIRRATAAKLADSVISREWLNTVKIITSMRVSAVPVRTDSVIRRIPSMRTGATS